MEVRETSSWLAEEGVMSHSRHRYACILRYWINYLQQSWAKYWIKSTVCARAWQRSTLPLVITLPVLLANDTVAMLVILSPVCNWWHLSWRNGNSLTYNVAAKVRYRVCTYIMHAFFSMWWYIRCMCMCIYDLKKKVSNYASLYMYF